MLDRGVVKKDQYRTVYTSQTFPTTGYGYAHNLSPEVSAKITQAFFTFDWPGTSLAEEFGKQANGFMGIHHKSDWDVIRKIDNPNAIDDHGKRDMIYLKNGDVIPCRVVSVGEKMVDLEPAFASAVTVSRDQVQAIDNLLEDLFRFTPQRAARLLLKLGAFTRPNALAFVCDLAHSTCEVVRREIGPGNDQYC